MKKYKPFPDNTSMMPPSRSLLAAGLASALGIAAAALLLQPAPPPADPYQASVRLAAGLSIIAGSLSLSRAIGKTLLARGGNSAFKALYWAALASSGTGVAAAASVAYPVDVPLAASLSAASFSGAGLMLLHFQKGGR